MKRLRSGAFLAALVLMSCGQDDGPARIGNSQPKYEDKKVELEKLYVIDVTRISLFSKETGRGFDNVMGFDGRNNLYILDPYECTISVFDGSGRFVGSFGGPGQGPQEFFRPSLFFIRGEEIHVLQGFGFDFKIVNLEGAFVSIRHVQLENPLRFYVSGKDVYLFSGKTDRTFTNLRFVVSKYESGRFDRGEVLLTRDYPPGLDGPNYDFVWPNWLLVSDSGEFYFPEDNLKKYSITKFGRDGKPKLIFGRNYDLREYSKKARDRFYALYGRAVEAGEIVFPQTPPVVRKMLEEKKGNIWVVSGETYEDNEDPEFENTVDVFSGRGEWLYSFKSKFLSKNCLYNDGKIYRIAPLDPDTYKQQIEVYGIKY